MARSGGRGATLADALGRSRAARFVGRAAEQEMFGQILSGGSSVRVVWIHGPGGVGKSSLTQAFRRQAAGAGRLAIQVDFASVEPRPDALLREAAVQGWATDGDPAPIITLDSFERAAALEGWLQHEWLPALPAAAIVVVAGRRPPSHLWRSDEGWRELLGEIRLRNFAPEETAAYLAGCDVPESEHETAAELTHGHPLALSLVADLARHDSAKSLTRLEDAPNLVDELVRRLVDSIPDEAHRRALQLCAHAWMTTEDLLREVLETRRAGELLAWLRGLSLVEVGPYGVFPHDLARDVIDADLRWRDAVAYADLHRRVQRSSVRRATQVTGAEQQRAIMQVVHAHRHSATAAFWNYDELGTAYFDSVRPTDADHLLQMTSRHQGDAQAALVEHWLGRQPGAFRVVRTKASEPAGFAAVVRLDLADASDLAPDPTMRAAREAIERRRPLRPGDHATVMRFLIDAERNQSPSRTLNLGPVLSIQTLLEDPATAWDVICWVDSGAMDPLMEFIDYQRLDGAEHRIGAGAYALFGRDFRRGSLADWFDLLADRELGAPVMSPTGRSDLLALSFDEFATSVGRALKDLHRRDQLVANPLCRSRLVVEGDDDHEPADRLAALIRDAADALAGHPREERLARAIDRTYLRPAPTQEAAAEVLGLPFSTYRRHLTRGVERIVEMLWRREIGGQEVSSNRSGE
ncbi:AAA family ATPase [Nocardioides xinjiangensis]|uniref:AAA family ATPase n=1 Tax=Nocardioides xinjiangensis TaxID=2817376 RepID=UPI001B30F2D7|nr:ATP-binding protein [Nocardioides sp. SYSU D00514]